MKYDKENLARLAKKLEIYKRTYGGVYVIPYRRTC